MHHCIVINYKVIHKAILNIHQNKLTFEHVDIYIKTLSNLFTNYVLNYFH